MKQKIILFSALAMIVITAAARPAKDKKPDFSGAWVEAPRLGGSQQSQRAPVNPGSGWGKQFTIVQTEDLLTIERIFFEPGDIQPPLKYRYSLTGSETKNTIIMGRGEQEQVSTTAWDGEKLVIKTIYESLHPVDGNKLSCEVTQTLSLLIYRSLPYSASLVVVTKRSGVLGGPPSTTRTVYRKN